MPITFDKPLTLTALVAIRGYTNKRFAEAVGAEASTVANWKQGRYLPSGRFIHKIEVALDTKYTNIIFGSQEL